MLLPAAIVLMALVFSCTRPADENASPDRSTIKIGYFGDLTGPTFNFGRSAINGVLLAADEINQGGGINHRRRDVSQQSRRGTTSAIVPGAVHIAVFDRSGSDANR